MVQTTLGSRSWAAPIQHRPFFTTSIGILQVTASSQRDRAGLQGRVNGIAGCFRLLPDCERMRRSPATNWHDGQISPKVIKEGSKLVDEEQFGPVLPVIKYSDKDDVIRRANATTYGLGASVWSSDASAPVRSQAGSSPARCGSTSISTWPRTSRSAAPNSRASAPNSPRRASPNSPSLIINGPPAA